MTRGTLILALTICAALPALAKDLGTTLKDRYQLLNTAIKKQDKKQIEIWVNKYCAKDFVYTSKDKHSYKKPAFLLGLKQQTDATKKVLESSVEVALKPSTSNTATVVIKTDFKGIVNFDGRDLTLTDKSESIDVWVKSGSDWVLKSSRQTKADTQMFQGSASR